VACRVRSHANQTHGHQLRYRTTSAPAAAAGDMAACTVDNSNDDGDMLDDVTSLSE